MEAPRTVNEVVTACPRIWPAVLVAVRGTVTVSLLKGTNWPAGRNSKEAGVTLSQLPGVAGESDGRGLDAASGAENLTVTGDPQLAVADLAGEIDKTRNGSGAVVLVGAVPP
jgi:hypothetical protein